MKTPVQRNPGFTLIEIMIVVGIIGMLAAIAIPNFIRSRAASQQNACINNLRQLSSAVNQWAMETGQGQGAAPPSNLDLTPYIVLNANSSIPQCPSQGTYHIYNVGNPPQVDCSLSSLTTLPHIYVFQ
jgi:prepilin-type N-terminal cleavage/methylation domain-containing protein